MVVARHLRDVRRDLRLCARALLRDAEFFFYLPLELLDLDVDPVRWAVRCLRVRRCADYVRVEFLLVRPALLLVADRRLEVLVRVRDLAARSDDRRLDLLDARRDLVPLASAADRLVLENLRWLAELEDVSVHPCPQGPLSRPRPDDRPTETLRRRGVLCPEDLVFFFDLRLNRVDSPLHLLRRVLSALRLLFRFFR